MKGLDTLIRAQRWRVDAMRREIVALEGLAAERRDGVIRFEAEVLDEQRHAARDEIGRYAYAGGYTRAVILRRAEMARAIEAVEAELADRRAQLAELFAELKRHELVLERHEARVAQEAARREAIALDELSLEMHRRGQG
jgi:hypothetical protein